LPWNRRNGLQNNIIVERRVDRFVVSQPAWHEAIDAVLWFRGQAVQDHGLSADAILPNRVHDQAFRPFEAWFDTTTLAERAAASSMRFDGESILPYATSLPSKLPIAMFMVYGGQNWVMFLLAVGADGINQDLVDCYNEEIHRRTLGGAHGLEPHPGPRLSERSLAAAQGQELPPVRGVQHERSPAFQARTRAKDLDRQARMSRGNVELQQQAAAAWDEAEALSEQAGVGYYDRRGVRQHGETDQNFMVTVVLQAYAERMGLHYDRTP